MSMISAKAFIERMKTDETFYKIITGCKDGIQRKRVLDHEGFDFNRMHFREALGELTDMQLEQVGGGQSYQYVCPICNTGFLCTPGMCIFNIIPE